MLSFTTPNGKEYNLKMVDGDSFYRWYGSGKTPALLVGGFTGQHEAIFAKERFLRDLGARNVPVVEKSPSEILKDLKSKEDLLSFARKQEVQIPKSMKIPSQIKKFLTSYFSEEVAA